MMDLLNDKVCIVTGAGKGFGRSITKVFMENGANLAVITRSQDDVDNLNKEYATVSNKFLAVCGDVTDQKAVNDFICDVINKYGRIDVLVNNAGMRFRKKFEEITTAEFKQVFEVNVLSMFMLCQAVIPIMVKQQKGKIINMSSVAGTNGLPELSGYVTSKAAVVGLTKSLAIEYAEQNIHINAIAPGFCKTSFYENFREKSGLYDFTIERTPMRRWGESAEIANVCLFLASNLSNYVTGDVINVDGGWSAW